MCNSHFKVNSRLVLNNFLVCYPLFKFKICCPELTQTCAIHLVSWSGLTEILFAVMICGQLIKLMCFNLCCLVGWQGPQYHQKSAPAEHRRVPRAPRTRPRVRPSRSVCPPAGSLTMCCPAGTGRGPPDCKMRYPPPASRTHSVNEDCCHLWLGWAQQYRSCCYFFFSVLR